MRYANPLEWQKAMIREEGYDALISSSPDNVAYTVGYTVPSQQLGIRKRRFAAVVSSDGPDVFLVVNVEFNQAKNTARIRDVRSYNEFTEDPMEMLADTLKEAGLGQGRIGVELDYLPARSFATLKAALPQVRFEDAEKTFDRLRMIKTQKELDTLKRIGGIVDRAHAEAYSAASPGWSELQLADAIRDSVISQGGEGITGLVVGSGFRSTWANCPPSEKVIEEGELVRVDVFAHINGYLSDIARTVAVGEPKEHHRDIWQRLVDAHTTILNMIKPGASTAAIWISFLDKFESLGLEPAIHFVGHGLGLTLHEAPYIDRYTDNVLEEGMVLAIEPVTHADGIGFHIEDEVIVTENGIELISDGRGEIMCIGNRVF